MHLCLPSMTALVQAACTCCGLVAACVTGLAAASEMAARRAPAVRRRIASHRNPAHPIALAQAREAPRVGYSLVRRGTSASTPTKGGQMLAGLIGLLIVVAI